MSEEVLQAPEWGGDGIRFFENVKTLSPLFGALTTHCFEPVTHWLAPSLFYTSLGDLGALRDDRRPVAGGAKQSKD